MVLHLAGQEYRLDYEPGESQTDLFGGNSNWRGPIWMPVNFLILLALRQYHVYYGEDFRVECPTGSGHLMNLHAGRAGAEAPAREHLPARRGRPARRLRLLRAVPHRSPLARPDPVPRVLPRRHRPGVRRQPPDRVDGVDRPGPDQPGRGCGTREQPSHGRWSNARAEPERAKETAMSTTMAPNVRGVGAPGRRKVYSMCGMCAVRCPMEVTVENGRVDLDPGESARRGHRRQPLREGRGRPRLRVRRPAAADAAHPQGPARQRPVAAGVLGRGPRLHRRQAEGDDRGLRPARHRALRSRRLLRRPDEDLREGARLAELLQPRRLLQRQRPQRRALDLRLPLRRARLRLREHEAPRPLRPQHRRIAHGQGGQGLHGRRGERDARHLHRPARHRHGLQGHPLLAGAAQQRLRAEPRPHPRDPEDRKLRQGLRRALRHRHGRPARGGQGHDARMAGSPHRGPRRRAPRLREGDRRPDAARDLPPGLDDGASQAVVPRHAAAR